MLKSKKILWLSDTLEQNNGVAQYIQEILPLLSKKINVELFTGRVTKKYGFRVHSLPSVPAPTAPDYDVILPSKPVKADLVHVHSPYSLGLHGAKYNCPKVVTAHFLPQHFLEWLFGQSQPQALFDAGWAYEIWFLNLFDRVVCQTHVGAKLFKKRGLRKPVTVIANGINLEKFKQGNAKRFEKKYRVKDFALFVGRVDASKRPQWVVAAAKALPKIQFVVAGVGSLLNQLERPKNVLFLGRIPRQELIDCYQASSVALMPSAAETEGLVAQEAMACGKPVIVSDNEVLDEVVGKAGLVCGNQKEFTARIKEMFETKGLSERLGEISLKQIQEREISNSVNNLIDLYNKLI